MSNVLLTGATGLIGSELLRRILEWDPATRVTLLVRSRRRRGATERIAALLDELAPVGRARDPGRLDVVEGDLALERFGLTPSAFAALARSLTDVYHLGADVRFDQPLEAARAVNVGSTLRLLELARAATQSGDFHRFHHVSTFAAARRDAELVLERPPSLTRTFRNSYERTKAEAEATALEHADEVPLTIHRVAIVVGDSRTGWTSKFDTFYMLIRLIVDGVGTGLDLDRVPIPGRALLNAVPVDFVADALYTLGHTGRGPSGEILHYTAGERTTRIFDALRAGIDHYVEYLSAMGETVPPMPELVAVDEVTQDAVSTALRTEVAPEAIEMMQQLMPYGFDNAVYDNRNLLRALEGTLLAPPPIARIVGPLVEYVLRTNWGQVSEARPPLSRRPI